MTNQAHIVLVGGSFNPPTLAHEAIIAACLALPEFDEVWLLPSGDRLDKSMSASDRHRVDMANIIKSKRFGNEARLKVSDFELNLPRPTQTKRTVRALAKAYPYVTFWWAFGADSFFAMSTWEGGLELQRSLNMIVFDRGSDRPTTQINVRHLELPASLQEISSTRVRHAVHVKEPLTHLVSNPILVYIKQHRLYT